MPVGLKSFDKECSRQSSNITSVEVKRFLDNTVQDTRRVSTAVNAFDVIVSHGQNLCKI
jgi:hypothetical protein